MASMLTCYAEKRACYSLISYKTKKHNPAPTEVERRYEPFESGRTRLYTKGILLGYLLYIKKARDGTRTRDPDLGKVVLYQLSHVRISTCQAPLSPEAVGGDARIRTGGEGFAGLCLTTWPRRHLGGTVMKRAGQNLYV